MPTTSNFGWTTPADTDLVKDGAAAIRTLGNGIDTSLVDLKGGTTGQILSKASNTDLDYTWIANDQGDITEVQAGTGISVASGTGPIPVVTNTMATAINAAGDLIYGTANDTFTRLGIGTAGQVLKVNSGATAPEWGAAAAGGKVLQVVQGSTATQVNSSTTTFVDTGLTATITPSAATSQILVMVSHAQVNKSSGNASNHIDMRLLRGATTIFPVFEWGFMNSAVQLNTGISFSYLDSPSTTSATTYKTQFMSGNNTAEVGVQQNNTTSTILLLEIGA